MPSLHANVHNFNDLLQSIAFRRTYPYRLRVTTHRDLYAATDPYGGKALRLAALHFSLCGSAAGKAFHTAPLLLPRRRDIITVVMDTLRTVALQFKLPSAWIFIVAPASVADAERRIVEENR